MLQMKKLKEIEIKEFIWILIRILIIFEFIFLSFIGIMNHEKWGDEAQAWLLARDTSLSELIFFYASYEGTPVLWHLILKLAISLRSYLFVVWCDSIDCKYDWCLYFRI